MSEKITATMLARNLSDILNRVQYRGERFVIERNGDVVAVLEPAPARKGTTIAEFIRRYGNLEMPGDGFADDLEAIQAAQRPIGDIPWPS